MTTNTGESDGGRKSGPLHLLVTAGPTREMIDRVRDWGNIFSGNTGLDIARAFLDVGDVTLLTSNEAHTREFDGFSGKAGMMGVETFRSHADLQALLEERMRGKVNVVAMTAAVADYEPAGVYRIVQRSPEGGVGGGAGREVWVVENVSAAKVKSSHDQIAIMGQRTLKLVDQFRSAWGYQGVLIKFKLEVGLSDEELIAVASASRTASGADLMVANTLAMARPDLAEATSVPGTLPQASGTGGRGEQSGPGAFLIDDRETAWVSRPDLAGRVTAWVRSRMGR
jgi:phosphopantothenoylcysteine synthetase/decarboxylase